MKTARIRAAGVLALAMTASTPAMAQPEAAPGRDPAAAEVLFAEGKRLMEAKKLAEACPKFEESNRLDPGVGALLNLAACQEQRGHIASAWGHYRDAASQLGRDPDPRRAAFARGRADALEPRLPRVVLTVVAPAPDLVVTRDGVKLSAASFGTELPVDPGTHTVVAEAPGHVARRTTFTVKERQVARVRIEPLEPAPVAEAPVPVVEPTAPPPSEAAASAGAGVTQRTAGFVTGGAGLVSLALGGVFVGLTAAHASSADEGCPTPTTCSAEGFASVESARTTALVADITLIGGGLLTAAGVVLVLTAPSSGKSLAIAPLPGGASIRGAF